MALISRAIPQVNVFFLGLPLKILLGIALVAISLPMILTRDGGHLPLRDRGCRRAAAARAAPASAPAPSRA